MCWFIFGIKMNICWILSNFQNSTSPTVHRHWTWRVPSGFSMAILIIMAAQIWHRLSLPCHKRSTDPQFCRRSVYIVCTSHFFVANSGILVILDVGIPCITEAGGDTENLIKIQILLVACNSMNLANVCLHRRQYASSSIHNIHHLKKLF